MNLTPFTTKPIEAIFKDLISSSQGLSETEIKSLQQKYGLNVLKGEQVYWWHILLRQFTSPFLYLLIASALLSFILGERLDGFMILLFVSINAILGFYQEYRSEQTLKLLKKYTQSQAKVIRHGKELLIDSTNLVPGDVIILEAGDIVPADVRIFEQQNLNVDESVLTGESVPVNKTAETLSESVSLSPKTDNIAFSGTTVISGKAKAIVLLIGKDTSIGQIANLTTETHRESSFEKGISRFSKFILYLILITLVAIFIINIFIKGPTIDIPNLLIFSIALAVSVIPEALPVVITFSLSRGALRLAKNRVVVKRLSAIEDLGSIEVLCTDKTGTLTENNLTLHKTFSQDPQITLFAALASTLAENKNHSIHSFDVALLKSLSSKDQEIFSEYERLQENPFDPDRKRSSMLIKKGKEYELVVRGAAEEIIKLSSSVSASQKKDIQQWIETESGNRIIAVAKKTLHYKKDMNTVSEENDLEFLGLISFVDPIKKTATEAVRKARSLGVQIKILTGDSREVAGSVACQIGLISDAKKVLTGDEFDHLSTEDQHEAVLEYSVFARVSPQQKYKVIQLLQEKFEVGFLGEGINDAPALKIANVAIVVQGATDIAREASDIILLKKSLEIIVDGIKEGRETFANTSKYIRATLASNFGNFYTVAISSLFITFLPLLPLQILLINLLTDFPMIAVSTDNVDSAELLRPRSYDIKEIALTGTILGIVSSVFDFIFFALFYKISPGVLQTNWFIGSTLTELLFMFSIRTKLPFFRAKRPSLILFILSGLAFATAIVLPFTDIGRSFFSFVTPSTKYLLMIFTIVISYFIVTEIVKLLYYRKSSFVK